MTESEELSPLAIWMQSGDEESITWSNEKIEKNDTLFIRADIVLDVINGDEIAKDAVLKIISASES